MGLVDMSKVIITGERGFVGKHLKDVVSDLPVIFNLASISSVEASIDNPQKVILNNIGCMIDVLECARDENKRLIHLSTVEATRPSNPYAASKAAQEEIGLSYLNTYGIPVIIARSHNIIGLGQSEEKFVPKLIKQIKAGKTVKIYGGGSRVYNPVKNVVDALRQLAVSGEPGKIYLIGGGERMTNLAMAKTIANLLNLPLKYELVAGRPGYKRALRGEGELIPNWTPIQTLEEGLRELL